MKGKYILIVENESLPAKTRKRELAECGYKVSHVTTGEQAVDLVCYKSKPVNIILMDIDLGRGIDGAEAAGKILECKDIPILFLSSHEDPEIIKKTEKITSYGYVAKSSSVSVLDASIKTASRLFESIQVVKKKEIRLTEKQDITDFSNLKYSISETERQIRFQSELLDSIEQAVIATDLNGKIVFWNKFAENLYGWEKQDVIGKHIVEISVPGNSKEQAAEIMTKLRAGEKWYGEFNVHHKSGACFLAHVSDYPVLNDKNELIGIIGISTDISDKKHLQIQQDKLLHNLTERMKELNCLYEIAKLINQSYITIEMLMEKLLQIIPISWQYPDVTCLRITLSGKSYQSENYSKKQWSLQKTIEIEGEKIGTLEVGYILEMPIEDEGPFLKEECDLINGIVFHIQIFLIREKRNNESIILEKAAITVLKNTDFNISARKVFNYAKEITGAVSGYVALLSDDGSENELLFLDDGGLSCSVDPDLPMPIRGLRAVAYNTGKAVMDNDFMNSEWAEYMPDGHCNLKNVLFAPLNIEGKVVGIIGLANKEKNFNRNDLRISELLGSITAMALINSKSKKQLEDALMEKDILMKEMNHRIKNNLLMVSSLIRLKNQALEGAADLSDIESRIDSIRLLHEYLYKNDRINYINLEEYIRRIISSVIDIGEKKVKLNFICDDIHLLSQKAAPVGLIVNELVTNAVKYAGIGNDPLDISVNAQSDSINNICRITVSNDGKPFPEDISIDNPNTFGLRLIYSLVDQLGGTMDLQKEPYPVFTFRFSFE